MQRDFMLPYVFKPKTREIPVLHLPPLSNKKAIKSSGVDSIVPLMRSLGGSLLLWSFERSRDLIEISSGTS